MEELHVPLMYNLAWIQKKNVGACRGGCPVNQLHVYEVSALYGLSRAVEEM